MEKVDEPQSSSGTLDSHTLPGRARVCTDHAHKLFAHLAVAQEIVGESTAAPIHKTFVKQEPELRPISNLFAVARAFSQHCLS